LEKEDRSGTQWTRRLIQFLWCECHALWKQHNDEVHGNKSQTLRQGSATQRARTALTALHEKAPHLLEADQRFFDKKPPAERLEAPTKVMRDWVMTHKPAVERGLWRAAEHDRLHNRDM
jgi:hypothetical protein